MSIQVIPAKEEGQLPMIRENGKIKHPGSLGITKENALEMREKSLVSRQNKIINAVKEAVKNGNDIPWEVGYQKIAGVLVEIILDKNAKDVNKIRAYKELGVTLGIDAKINAGSMQITQTNVFLDNPAAADAFLSARCPDCDAIRKYGVAHACVAVDANVVLTKMGNNEP